MKKIMLLLLILWIFKPAHAFSPVRQVQISTGAIPQQAGYYNVVGGTVTNIANKDQISTGTYTINGGTMSWINGVSTGTRFDKSTTTFVGAGWQGTLLDASTKTVTGGTTMSNWTTYTGSTTFSASTVAFSGARLTGTIQNDSTATITGSQTFSSATITNLAISSAVILGTGNIYKNPSGYSAFKVVSWSSGSRTSAFTTTSTSFQGAASSCTITPSSTSNWVAVFAIGTLAQTTSGQLTFGTIGRNGTNIGGINGTTNISVQATAVGGPATLFMLDAPGTTSATIYQPMIRVSANSGDYCASNTTCTTLCFELAP